MRSNAKKLGKKNALVTSSRTLTWHELDQMSEIAALNLKKSLKKSNNQQVIALLLPNSWQFVVAYLAILKVGQIAMPLDPAYKTMELENIANQIKPNLIITDREDTGLIPHLHNLVLVDDLVKQRPLNEVLENPKLSPDKLIATLLFTSGTTGKPKAAPYTHANHIWNIDVSSKIWGWKEKDTLLISLPLSHWHGLVIGLSGAIYHGNTLYLHERFDAKKTLTALASGKISIYTHVSIAYLKMVQVANYKKYNLDKVRLCLSASASLPPATWWTFKERFGIEIIESYGSSETGRISSNTYKDRQIGSPGKPLPGVRVRLNPNGELLVKSEGGMFPGYYKNKNATSDKYTKDGWWHTGDIVSIKKNHIFIRGRVQERIKKMGWTLYPRDIEWILMHHKDIREAFVMGLPNEGNPNDQLVYFIASDVLDERQVRIYSKSNMPYAWLPDLVIILPELPKTRSGKPELSKLRALVNDELESL